MYSDYSFTLPHVYICSRSWGTPFLLKYLPSASHERITEARWLDAHSNMGSFDDGVLRYQRMSNSKYDRSPIFALGRTLVIVPSLDPLTCLSAIQQFKITQVPVTPWLIKQFVMAPRVVHHPCGSRACYGGDQFQVYQSII